MTLHLPTVSFLIYEENLIFFFISVITLGFGLMLLISYYVVQTYDKIQR